MGRARRDKQEMTRLPSGASVVFGLYTLPLAEAVGWLVKSVRPSGKRSKVRRVPFLGRFREGVSKPDLTDGEDDGCVSGIRSQDLFSAVLHLLCQYRLSSINFSIISRQWI